MTESCLPSRRILRRLLLSINFTFLTSTDSMRKSSSISLCMYISTLNSAKLHIKMGLVGCYQPVFSSVKAKRWQRATDSLATSFPELEHARRISQSWVLAHSFRCRPDWDVNGARSPRRSALPHLASITDHRAALYSVASRGVGSEKEYRQPVPDGNISSLRDESEPLSESICTSEGSVNQGNARRVSLSAPLNPNRRQL